MGGVKTKKQTNTLKEMFKGHFDGNGNKVCHRGAFTKKRKKCTLKSMFLPFHPTRLLRTDVLQHEYIFIYIFTLHFLQFFSFLTSFKSEIDTDELQGALVGVLEFGQW